MFFSIIDNTFLRFSWFQPLPYLHQPGKFSSQKDTPQFLAETTRVLVGFDLGTVKIYVQEKEVSREFKGQTQTPVDLNCESD